MDLDVFRLIFAADKKQAVALLQEVPSPKRARLIRAVGAPTLLEACFDFQDKTLAGLIGSLGVLPENAVLALAKAKGLGRARRFGGLVGAHPGVLEALRPGGSLAFDRTDARVESLPPGLVVPGDLTVGPKDASVALPERLEVLGRCLIQRAQSLVQVGTGSRIHRLSVAGCPRFVALAPGYAALQGPQGEAGEVLVEESPRFAILPEGITGDPSVLVYKAPALRRIPAFRAGALVADCCGVEEVAEGFWAEELNLWGCESLKALPASITGVGTLILSGCRSLRSLPPGLWVRKDLYVDGSGVESFPPGIRVDGALHHQGCRAEIHDGVFAGSLVA